MILILSVDWDISTDKIEDWLIYHKANYLRVNTNSLPVDVAEANLFDGVFEFTNGLRLVSKEIDLVYFRKWFPNNYITKIPELSEAKNPEIIQHLKTENAEFSSYFINSFKNAKWIDNYIYASVNKLDQLIAAKDCGINVPGTVLTRKKENLKKFIDVNTKVISKPIISTILYPYNGSYFSTYAELITPEFFHLLPEEFQLSLFQEYIDKKFEIRSVYVDGDFYSLAYFSQQDELTSVDFKKGTPGVNFKTEVMVLPVAIEAKLTLLMKKLHLLTGSFDLVYTKNKEFVFLEVNPCGILDNVSHLGNFNIEEKMAKMLMKYDRN